MIIIYASQTKILENGTSGWECLFEGLCDGSSPKSITHQAYATRPPFLDNMHFEHFVKYFNLSLWLKYLTKCSKWRFDEMFKMEIV